MLRNVLPRSTAANFRCIVFVDSGHFGNLGVSHAGSTEISDSTNQFFVDGNGPGGSPGATAPASVCHVLRRSSCVEMAGVDAGRVVAGVADEHTVRNVAMGQFKGKPMGTLMILAINQLTISLWNTWSNPLPAILVRPLIDLVPKMLLLAYGESVRLRHALLGAVLGSFRSAAVSNERGSACTAINSHGKSGLQTLRGCQALRVDGASIGAELLRQMLLLDSKLFAALGTISGRLSTHFWSLLNRFRGAVPRVATNNAGAFATPNYTSIAWEMEVAK